MNDAPLTKKYHNYRMVYDMEMLTIDTNDMK